MSSPHSSHLTHMAARPIRQQRGVVMIVALIVLVALTIASIGLLRSVDTSSTIAGNLGLKKDLYRVSNLGVQYATARLALIRLPSGELPQVDTPNGNYFANSNGQVDDRGLPTTLVNAALPTTPGEAPTPANCNLTNPPLGTALCIPVPVDSGSGVTTSGGYVMRYVAERLCPNAGPNDDSTNQCRKAAGAGARTIDGTQQGLPGVGTVYIRLSLRVDGPKNSTSYFQYMLL